MNKEDSEFEERWFKRLKKSLELGAKTPDSEKLRLLDGLPEYVPPPAGDQVVAAFMVEKKPREYFKALTEEDIIQARKKFVELCRFREEEIIYDEEIVKSLGNLIDILTEAKNEEEKGKATL
jgi:hypothetical protein